MYSFKNDSFIVIRDVDKGSGVVVWDREDYLKGEHKQLSDEEVYEDVTNDHFILESTIYSDFNKINDRGDLSADT